MLSELPLVLGQLLVFMHTGYDCLQFAEVRNCWRPAWQRNCTAAYFPPADGGLYTRPGIGPNGTWRTHCSDGLCLCCSGMLPSCFFTSSFERKRDGVLPPKLTNVRSGLWYGMISKWWRTSERKLSLFVQSSELYLKISPPTVGGVPVQTTAHSGSTASLRDTWSGH